MADKRQLTDRFLRSLPPAKHGTRNDIWDSVVPTFGACVYDDKDSDPSRRGKAGRIAFIMYTRFKRGAAPARRIIGTYGAITLEDARRTAGEWRSLIAKGIDRRGVGPDASDADARRREGVKARAVMRALAIVRDVLSRCRQAADVAAPVDQNRHQRRVLAGQLPLAARALVSAAAIERASAMTEETAGYFAFASR